MCEELGDELVNKQYTLNHLAIFCIVRIFSKIFIILYVDNESHKYIFEGEMWQTDAECACSELSASRKMEI